MKILYYSAHPNLNLASPAGYGTHMREMIHAFGILGHKVKTVIMGGESINETDLSIKPRSGMKKMVASAIPVYVWESLKDLNLLKFDRYAFQKLEEAIREFEPDVIYERAAYLQSSGIRASKKYGIKHVLEVNAPYAEERIDLQGKSFFTKKGLKTEKLQLEWSDKVAVVSSALQKYLSKAHRIDAGKFVLTPNAINPDHLKYDKKEAAAIIKKHQIQNKFIIGFVGSIFPWHGVDLLIEAFGELSRLIDKKMHLLVVGDGETLSLLKDQVRRLQIQEHITFTGNIPHRKVFNYMAVMDVCVMAKSNWYGSPVKLFEYGAMGKAVIAPDTIPVKDVMIEGEMGLLVPPVKENLLEAMRSFVTNEPLRRSCSKRFKEKIFEEHTWVQNAKKVIGEEE